MMEQVRAFFPAVGRMWASGCLGKIIVSVGVLFVLGICNAIAVALSVPRPAATSATSAPAAAPTTAPELTAAPSATGVPTATPTAAPPPTHVPPPTELPTPTARRQSGGLGLKRAEWEANHGPGTKDPITGYAYDGNTYLVSYQADPAGAETVWTIEQRWSEVGALSLEDARLASKMLIPDDSTFVRTYTSPGGRTVDLYTSEWLKGRFVERLFIGGEPGDFIVLYRAATGKVTSIIVVAGNNP